MDLIVWFILFLHLFIMDVHPMDKEKLDPEVYHSNGFCSVQNSNGLSTLLGAKKCKYLALTSSNITDLSKEIFEGLSAATGLHTVDVLRGNVGSIYLPHDLISLQLDDSRTMQFIIDANGTYKLEEIILYRLPLLPDNSFELHSLKKWFCSEIYGANIDLSSFNKMVQLEKILIAGIAGVETSESLELQSLRTLVILNSSITFNVDACWIFPNLDELSLDSNDLLVIPEHFSSFTNLTVFGIRNNKLRYVRLELFANMKQLKTLNLMDNEILRLTTDKMIELPCLEELFLENNKLTELNFTSWIVPVLHDVLLTKNQLKRVTGLLGMVTTKLQTLQMFNNPWDCDWLTATVKQIPFMQIYVMYNGTCFAFGQNMAERRGKNGDTEI